jgi:1-acyl-sn-glycerol-3-phosphate acyltransferase
MTTDPLRFMPDFCTGDSYETPPERNRCLLDRLLRPGNLYFYYRIFRPARWFQTVCNHYGMTYDAMRLSAAQILFGIEECGGHVQIEGLEQLDRANDKGAVIIANHMSSVETLVLAAIMQRRGKMTFVVKKELFDYPVFGTLIRNMRCIPMTRTDPKTDLKTLMGLGPKLINEGVSIVVFPQSTRAESFDPADFNSIGTKLAKRAGAVIIPLALETSIWGRGKSLSDYGPVRRERPLHFAFGEMIPAATDHREAHRRCLAFITDKVAGWQAQNAGKA